MDASSRHFLVILAGGGGTRLWPHSRKGRPKQFLPMLAGGETLIGATVRRSRGVVPIERTLVVTTAAQVPELRRCLPDLSLDNIVVEPIGRNTAPCIGLAAVMAARRDPNAVLAVLPSDHFVADEAGFAATLRHAFAIADAGHVVTLGIKPTHPETGYGYIEVGTPVEDKAEPGAARFAEAFVEKPDAARAAEYLSSGRYLWNSGTFFFPAQRILSELRANLPALATILDGIAAHPEHISILYPEAQSISIDYAVMERLGRQRAGADRAIRVLPSDFGWSDVGSFAALSALHPADSHDNHVVAEPGTPTPLLVDATGNLIWAGGTRLVTALGVRDLVIAATEDAVLVVPRSRAQDVREIVAALQGLGQGQHV